MPDAQAPPEPKPDSLTLQVLDKLGQLTTAAFGLVAALAWNDAIRAAFQRYYAAGEALRVQFLYAILVTILAVLAAVWIAAAVNRAKRKLRRERPDPGVPQAPAGGS